MAAASAVTVHAIVMVAAMAKSPLPVMASLKR